MGGPSPGIIISTYWWVRSFLTDLPGLSVLPDREHRPMILPIYRSPARMKICDRSIRAILNTGFYLISGGEIMIIMENTCFPGCSGTMDILLCWVTTGGDFSRDCQPDGYSVWRISRSEERRVGGGGGGGA